MSGAELRRAWVLPLLSVALGACAGPRANRRPDGLRARGASEARVWEALGRGDDEGARKLIDSARGGGGDTATLALADGALAFERGEVGRAIASYLAVLEGAATDESSLAAMAAGRLATLLEEHPGPDTDRRAVEERILAVSPARWSWQARYGLANLWDRIARRRGDPVLLAQVGARAGCIGGFAMARPLGRLPHLDLDATPVEGPVRAEAARGCRVAVPSYEGRAGAQRILIDVDAPAAGSVDVVIGFRGEGRLVIDGGPSHAHGGEFAYGPQLSAVRATWSAGRHRLELRLATYGGRPELTVLVVPAVVPPVPVPALPVPPTAA